MKSWLNDFDHQFSKKPITVNKPKNKFLTPNTNQDVRNEQLTFPLSQSIFALMKNVFLTLFGLAFCLAAFSETDILWKRGTEVLEARENIYLLEDDRFHTQVMAGRRAALFYPVTISDLYIPYRPMEKFFESSTSDPARRIIFKLMKVVSPFKSMNDLYSYLGLSPFPGAVQTETPNEFPPLSQEEKALPMGATIISTDKGEVLTFGCAACHSGDLFGVKVLGLTNRFPRANEFFRQGTKLAPYVNSFLFKGMLEATEGERQILVTAKKAMHFVGTKKPMVLGLDTSLAQVALSLSRRQQDEYSTRTNETWRHPRPNKLESLVADSKPAVWWNLKYKNRWLSDGSIVSGNPIHTNFLWNEIGRGTDLKKLEAWMEKNIATIENLTAAVFASRSPRFEEFFGVEAIDIEKARRGQKHYQQSCQKCHGIYEKGWDHGALSASEQIKNIKVSYHRQTPVKDVGTDPGRYLGMKEFAEGLNGLAISKAIGTVVEPQKGYVPPPLDGIWARWPYFHNNSVPNLCALLTRSELRPKTYWAGHAVDKSRDFDQSCVGYPLAEKVPPAWKRNKEYLYDTSIEGLSNKGHDEKIFLKAGQELFTPEEKSELIEFLKTL